MLGASVVLPVTWTSSLWAISLGESTLWVGSFHGLPEGLSSAALSQTHRCLLEPQCVFRLLLAQLNGDPQ